MIMYVWNLDLINVLACQLIEVKFRSKFTHPWGRLCPLAKEEFINTLGVFENNVFDTAQMKTSLQQEFL